MNAAQNPIDRLVENARRYADGLQERALESTPATGVAVLACMDARLNLEELLGLEDGDAHLIRNAGGVVNDEAIRSLAISQHKLGTEAIMLIHHTKCGMLSFTDEELAEQLASETGQRPHWRAQSFRELELDIREGIAAIEASPFIPRTDQVRGFIFDVDTGALHEVS